MAPQKTLTPQKTMTPANKGLSTPLNPPKTKPSQSKPVIRKTEEIDSEYLKNAPQDELNYIKQIEGSPKSLQKATEPDEPEPPVKSPPSANIKTKPKSDMPKAPADYTIKLKKIKKPKKNRSK